MPPGPEQDGRYGPLLSELIGLQELNLPLVSNPSRNEIRQAIYSLSDPESVSYMTFATILAMERAPTCNHLALLASDACIFPACIKLLRKYCHVEGQGLFDHAYGLLCFQIIVLSIQTAILLQTEQLDSFLATITNQPHGSSIFSLLRDRVLQAEIDAAFGPRRRGTMWLLGWYGNEIAGQKRTCCLENIGGFTISDAKFLVEQTWLARADFLSVATVAERRLYGWGSFLHVVWTVLGNNYGGIGPAHVGGPPGSQTPDQKQCWIHFVDLGTRYALCSSEAEDTLMPAFLENSPDYSKSWNVKAAGTRSTLGAQDSSHIVQAFLTKLRVRPKIHILFSTMLFSYTCENLERPDTHKNLSQVLLAILGRSWAEVIRIQELNAEQFADFLHHITVLLRTMTGLLATNRGQTQYIAEAISDYIFIEFLGRFTLSLLLVTEGALYELIGISGQSHLAQQLINFGASLKAFSLHHNLSPNYFLAWHKITQHLDFCLLMLSMPQFLKQRHIHPWHKCWSTFGSPLALEERFYPTTQCGYPRCATPNSVLLWECSSCKSKWYCGQRCQKADWIGRPDSHMHHCRSL